METKGSPDRIEERFAAFGANIDRLIEKVEHSQFVAALRSELTVWQEWLDEAKVQSALGSMEARARLEAARKSLEETHSRLSKRVEELEHAAEFTPELSDSIRHELESVKDELSSPEAFAQ